MGIDARVVAELVAPGICTGFLSGLMGIGGGVLMVPVLTFLLSNKGVPNAMAVKMAIATSMATILFTALSSLRAHQRRGAVRWDFVRGMSPGVLLGALVAGAGVFALVKGPQLAVFFALFICFSATQMLLDRKPAPGRSIPGGWGLFAAGGLMGLLAALVGAGGAFIAVPFMTWCNVPMHKVVATSAALGFPVALAGTLGYVISGWSLPPAVSGAFGYLYLPALVIIAAASVSFAPLGARAAHAMDVVTLKRRFAIVMFVLAGYMVYKAAN